MKKTKIFQEAFSDILIPQGFIYKNRTFIRVIGENIVQSLYLESSSPMYSFELNLAPAATLTSPTHLFQNMKREFRGLYALGFNNFSEFPHVTWQGRSYEMALKDPQKDGEIYYPEEYIEGKWVERCIANMEKAAELFKRDYLPILDATTDFNSYLKFREAYLEDKTLFFGRVKYPLTSFELLYKAYLDGNSKYGVTYLKNYEKWNFIKILKGQFADWEIYDFEKFFKLAEEMDMEFVGYGFDEDRVRRFSPAFVEKTLAEVESIIYSGRFDIGYDDFWDCVYTNDFSNVPKQWAAEEELVLNLIKEAFPKIKLA